jgi:hypothetical protein
VTTILNRKTEFGGITGMGGPASDPLVAIAGPRHTILRGEKSGGQMVYLGESEDLGAEVLAVNNETVPNYHVLTAAGAVIVDNADSPQIVTSTAFKPGDGRWLALFSGAFLATPLANGGVQILNATTLAQVSQLPSIVQDSRFAYGYASNSVLYVVDSKAAKICVLKVTASGQLQFVGRIAAPNCRDVIKVVLDENPASIGNLFVVCRRRIVRFTVTLLSVTDDDDLLPTFAEDYGVATADYTDLVVLGDNQYWISQDYPTSATPLDAYYGPMLGVWDASLNELFVAAPKASIWTVNDVIPYYDEDTVVETISPPVPPVVVPPVVLPPVVAPPAPVITSTLTASLIEDTLFSYTITATGVGPITYGVTSPPAWLTSINPLTGAISGTPADPATVNLSITATNAGGTTTATLVVTVSPAIANMGAVTVDQGVVNCQAVDGNLLYIGGTFTTVTEANGTYTRNRLACLNLTTGLWTSWAPSTTVAVNAIAVFNGAIFVGSNASATVAGVACTGLSKISAAGVADASFPAAAVFTGTTSIKALLAADKLYVAGQFTVLNGGAYVALAAFNSSFVQTTWKPYNSADVILFGVAYGLSDAGSEVLWTGDGQLRLQTGADPATKRVSNFGRSLKTDGYTAAYGYGGFDTSYSYRACVALGSNDYIGGTFLAFDKLPTGTPDVSRTNLGIVGGKASVSAFAPNPATAVLSAYVDPSNGDVWAGFATGGKIQHYTSAGAGATTPTWTGGSGTAVHSLGSYAGALIFTGDFAGATINGAVRSRLVFMNIATGVLY